MSTPTPIPRMPRADSLTGLRWWAAFGVFAFHMENLAPLPIQAALQYGNFGVTFFFVLSGFVLTWSWSPRVDARTFWWRRVARIYPASLVALVLAIPVFYAVTPDPAQWWVKPFGAVLLLSVVLLQGWSRDPAILFSGNPAAWTLTCEAFFYTLHPLFQRGLRRLGTRGALVVAGAIVVLAFSYRAAATVSPGSWWAAQMPWPVIRVTEFGLGMCGAWAVRRGWHPTATPWLGYGLIVAFLGWLVWATSVADPTGHGTLTLHALAAGNEIAMLLCVVVIVLVATRDLRGVPSLLRSRVLVLGGEWSYSFYLVHATVIYGLRASLGIRPPGWSNLLWYAGTLVVALVVAGALHLLVEKPVERGMRQWWDNRRERISAARAAGETAAP